MSIPNRFRIFVFTFVTAATAFAAEKRVEYFAARTGKIVNFDPVKHRNFKVRLFIFAMFHYPAGHPVSGAYWDLKEGSVINTRASIRPDGTFDVPALHVSFEPGSEDAALDSISMEVALEDQRNGGYHMMFIERGNLWENRWGEKMEENRAAYNKLWKPFRISKERWGKP